MDYRESRQYIEDAARYGSVLGLDNMRELMKRLGNPQEQLSIVHVAGTNGKGSVIAYLYEVLKEAGYRVGRYISPTLFSYRERLEISGTRITREQFAGYLTRVALAIEAMTQEGHAHPTPFEIETAVAFLYFADQACEIVLLEVGMGGNLDATNVFERPLLSVITSISMDHMGFLGNSLYEIAQKKAGIIKEQCPMVSAHQEPEAERAIREACEECHAEFVEADPGSAKLLEESVEGQTFEYEGAMYQIPLAGVHQIGNAVLALEALKQLQVSGFLTSVEQRQKGLAATEWKGRLSIIGRDPLFIVDGAHNPAAAETLAESVRHYFPGKRLIFIMGVFADKDYRTVIEDTYALADQILTIQTPDNPRALPAEELAQTIREYTPHVEAMPDIPSAVRKALALAKKDDVILAFGSLSFAGPLCEAFEKERNA